jgi:C-terminal processing protease CtpA/Prc
VIWDWQVGIILHGIVIDNVIVGGPAYDSKLLEKGDAILQVDRVDVSAQNIQQFMVGSDVPESTVILTVRKASGRIIDVVLKRISASVIADRYKILSLFSQCQVSCHILPTSLNAPLIQQQYFRIV